MPVSTLIDLNRLYSLGFAIGGAAEDDYAGVSVALAGDINGDGFDDFIIGAIGRDDGGEDAGGAYVIFGKAEGFADIDLAALTPADGFFIQGEAADDHAGRSVSGAGDVNGDGFDDVIVATNSNDDGGNNAGQAYVIFGKAGGFTDIDLSSLDPADGFSIQGGNAGDYAGFRVASDGDINGDGADDIMISAPGVGFAGGVVYVIFGRTSGFSNIDLGSLAPADGFVIDDSDTFAQTYAVASAGDLNGDGYEEFMVCAPNTAYPSETYVIFGKPGGFSDFDLATLDPADGFTIFAEEPGDNAGQSLASAGDVNGDGFDDLIIGAHGDDYPVGTRAGAAYVIFGKADGFDDVDLAALDPADGFSISGDEAYDEAGYVVSSAGDFNGDGFDDLIVSAPGVYLGGASGATYVIFGKAAPTDIDLDTLSSADGFVIGGKSSAGSAASSAGDVNDDGFDDLLVGAYLNDDGHNDAGAAFIIFGAANFSAIALDDSVSTTESVALLGTSVFGNDFDVDGPALEVGEVEASAVNVGLTITLASGALLTLRADGTYDYDPNGSFDWLISPAKSSATGAVNISATDSFTYTLVGGTTATVTVTINGEDSAGDELWGDAGNNFITGTSASETIRLDQGGNDTASGQDGNDFFVFGATFDELDSIDGGEGFDWLFLDGDYASNPLVLAATSLTGIDIIHVRFGHNYEITFDDANVADGELMTIDASDLQSDTLFVDGSLEADGLFKFIGGEHSFDDFRGGAGADILIGRGGLNFLDGNGGTDTADYHEATGAIDVDLAAGTADNGWGGSDTLEDIENVVGSSFADVLAGSADNNRLDGGAGADELRGRDGNDTYVVDNGGDTVVEAGTAGSGTDTVESSISYTLPSHLEILALTGLNAVNGTGNALANTLIGNNAANLLNGGFGADTMQGGLGNDTYIIDNAGDVVTESAGAGTDTVQSSLNHTLGANFERLVLTGTGNTTGTGNGLANIITGNSGANAIDGGAGGDIMIGGGGNDSYFVDNGLDIVTEAAGGGTDTVNASLSHDLEDEVENMILTGAAAINGTGNDLANTLTGNGAANRLDGGLGADTLKGGLGDDTYVVDQAGDVVSELAGQGTDKVETGISYTLASAVENLILTGTGNIDGTGNLFANILMGNSGANRLNGGGGADTMNGGLGDDLYVVDNAGDVVIESSFTGGTDTVESSVSFVLGPTFENLTLTGANAISGTGNALGNTIHGNGAANSLSGLGGDDSLFAGAGNDNIATGLGTDRIYFDTALNAASNVDAVTDFNAALDTFFLDDAVFAGLAAGTLAAGAFQSGAVALDADDRILHDSATNRIYFDADGAGGAAAILFATVTAGTALTNADFVGY